MMKAELIEHIEQYLDGQIDRKKLEELVDGFEVENLEEEINWVKDTRVAIEAAGLRDQLKGLNFETEKKEAKVVKFGFVRTISAIAATALILAVAYWLFLRKQTSSLYEEYLYTDPGLPVLMSQSEDHLLYDALTYFGEGNYEVALNKLKQIEDQYPNNDTLQYYSAASLLYLDKAPEAIPYFEALAEDDSSEFHQNAEWLLVLSSLKEENFAIAQQKLTSILNDDTHPFLDEARQLKAELDAK